MTLCRNHSTRPQQDVGDQFRRRLYFCQRLQPGMPSLSFMEQRAAELAHPSMGFERCEFFAGQSAIYGLAEQRVEFRAAHPVIFFAWHHITCLYVRCKRRASSARPRLILDLTVPSGTFSTVAISR